MVSIEQSIKFSNIQLSYITIKLITINISIDEWKLTYTWMKDCGRILSLVDQTDNFIVHKSK